MTHCSSSRFSPDLAAVTSFDVVENDLILIATDGVWDNLPDATILEETRKMIVSSLVDEAYRRDCLF